MTNFNLERTRAPRRRVPWWVYAGAIIVAGLLIFAIVKALPSRKPAVAEEPSPIEEPVEETAPVVSAAPTPAPVAKAQLQSAPVTPASDVVRSPTAPAPQPAIAAVPAAPVATQLPVAASTPQVREALASKEAGDYGKAREQGLAIWKNTTDANQKMEAEALLNEINIALVLTPRPMPEKVEYVVQSGDSLEKIAKKFGTTIELIRAGNNIKGSMIRVGDRLRIFQGKFSVSVSKSDNDLVLYMNDEFFKRYRVGTGEYNKTPVGDFVINDRIAQPTWWRPDGKSIPFGDPENLLGTHWLSINVKGYGLHGTWEPDTIGKQLSAGCVRMLNEDIEQLYTLLTLGTPVSIRD